MGIKDFQIKEVGSSVQECLDEGLPDKDGFYHFLGTIREVKFSNPSFYDKDKVYNVCIFETENPIPKLDIDSETRRTTGTIVGDTIELIPAKKYRFKAKLVENEKFHQWQYQIENVEEAETTTKDINDRYLAFIVTPTQYGLIKQIDPDFVSKIFEDSNYRLPKLKGQTDKAMSNIHENVLKYKEYVTLISKLGQFPEFSLNTIMRISQLENNPQLILKKIEEDPYVLTKLNRFGWKKVDKLALSMKPEMRSSTSRLISFCKGALEDIATASDGGHTWIFINNPSDPKHSMAHLIKNNVPECQPYVKDYFATERELTKTKGCGTMFYVDNDRIGLAVYFRSERSILKHLNRIKDGEHLTPIYTVEDAVKRTNYYMSQKAGEELSLTEEQVDTIKATLDNDVVILTAHAGAGKSTTIKGIVELWRNRRIACCALAAKAAIRIQEVTGQPSFTIHRLLGFQKGRFSYDENSPLPYDLVIVDECSMINVGLFLSLLKAVRSGAKLILVFDDAQLPAIGAGSVAKDLLASDFCIKKLTKIHRQAAKSGIKIDANNIRQQIDVFAVNNDYDASGTTALHVVHGENQDMHYFNVVGQEGVHLQTMIIYKDLIAGGGLGGADPIPVEDISIIVPMKSNMRNCTDSFNQEIQELLLKNEKKQIKNGNYQDKDKTARVFKLGCRVIRKKNDYEKMVFNGEVGTIIDISDSCSDFLVKFDDDRVISFKSKELAYFDLAYALTVHSMQGSENKVVIFVMDVRHTILLDSTLFYTAVTRAREKNFVVFQQNAYLTAYTTDKVLNRQTFLPLLINGAVNSSDENDSMTQEEEEEFEQISFD